MSMEWRRETAPACSPVRSCRSLQASSAKQEVRQTFCHEPACPCCRWSFHPKHSSWTPSSGAGRPESATASAAVSKAGISYRELDRCSMLSKGGTIDRIRSGAGARLGFGLAASALQKDLLRRLNKNETLKPYYDATLTKLQDGI